jgi:hypothetical protein
MRFLSGVFAFLFAVTALAAPATVTTDPQATPRELYGASRLSDALDHSGAASATVLVGVKSSSLFTGVALPDLAGRTESFHLGRAGNRWVVEGSDPSGVLYGCLELARRVTAAHGLPRDLDVTDGPAFRIRGTNLFWMKKGTYNWPITREGFPWFYDRQLMGAYLDELAANGYNTIYFWAGHPFPFFLELPRYPEARELTDAQLRDNIDQLKWFTTEADRRGIWTVFHFYNIHVSPPFAQAHANEGVQVENTASTPLLEAYTRYCVSEFVKSYPNVGIMLTAGEALQVKQEEFIRDAIIAGIRDSGKHPPLIVRQWMINPYRYRDIVKPAYDNLYTMMKHNTEMLVSPYADPRNKTWISFGQSHIINVHLDTDAVPYRWGSPVFIHQMVENWKQIGAAGLHLYPLVSWSWPETMDRTTPPLSTVERDRIWLEAFGRYVWNPDRPAAQEEKYWTDELARRFGSPEAGRAVYNYYVQTGPVLPGLQNTINIYNMGWHPPGLGQEETLNGILHSDRWEDVGDSLARPLDDLTLGLYEKKFGSLSAAARAKPPLSVKEYVAAELASRHDDAIPPDKLSALFIDMTEQALAGLEAVRGGSPKENVEYGRFANDARCLVHLSRFYHAKIQAAIEKGLYDGTGGAEHYARMLANLQESVKEYAQVEEAASPAYRQASDIADWFQWKRVRKEFEDELAFYQQQASVAEHGADVVYIGLDGPMNNAGDTFYWVLDHYRQAANWPAQSYDFNERLLSRAKLAVVFDPTSAAYRKLQPALEAWVRGGGKLLIWDPLARASHDSLLAGITFWADPSYYPSRQFAYTDVHHPLLEGLAGSTAPAGSLLPGMRAASEDWHELAYTVLASSQYQEVWGPWETFGPRWTSLANPARVPVMLARDYGAGTVVIVQLGQWSIPAKPDMNPDRMQEAPPHLLKLAANLISWAGGKNSISAQNP